MICIGLGVVVQLENYLLYVDGNTADRIWFLIRFPFLHLETILIGFVLGAGYWFCARWLGSFYLILPIVCNVLVVIDQCVYKAFRDHMRLSQMEHSVLDIRGLRKLLSSAFAEVDAVFILNVGLLLITSFFLIRSKGLSWRIKPGQLIAGFGVYALLGISVVWATKTHHLHEYPLLRIWQMPDVPDHAEWILPTAKLYRPVFGTHDDKPEIVKQLVDIKASMRKREKQSHVVFVVLESVGALQLLREGRPKPDVAPFLYSLSERAVIFDTIYGLFPSTTRMHVPLMTGGRTITWGQVGDELVHAYKGPTLIGQIEKIAYRAAMFSAQDIQFESMDLFYAELPYDKQVYYGDGSQTMVPEQEVHAWGVWEEALVDPALAWVDSALTHDAFFFLHLNTVSTHYPYGTGPGYKGPMEGDDRKANYYNALHYTDYVLKSVCDSLAVRGVLDNTLFVVTGDHGQAFSEIHDGNLTHRNFLYEENIRTFLMISDPHIDKPVVSHRVGTVGDMMGTLLPFMGGDAGEIPGRDLFDPDFELQVAFFHKSSHPELWGLRDGQWKYVAKHNGDEAELYDLIADPQEQKNLAVDYPERLAVYHDLCAEWFVSTNYDYIRHLDNFQLVGETGFKKEELGHPGPKVISFVAEDAPGQTLELKSVLHPEQPFLIWTRWVAYGDDKSIRYEIIPPDSSTYDFDFTVDAQWDVTWVDPQIVDRMDEGRWTVRLFDVDSLLLAKSFEVKKDAVLRSLGTRTMFLGPLEGDDFVDLSQMHSNQPFVIWNTWSAYLVDKAVQYELVDPNGKIHRFDFVVKGGWKRTWFDPELEKNKVEGIWTVRVFDGDEELITSQFEVTSHALLRGTGPQEMAFGTLVEENTFHTLDRVHPDQPFVIWTRWQPPKTDIFIQFEIVSPSGDVHQFDFRVEAGWDQTWFNPGLYLDKEVGTWDVRIIYEGRVLIHKSLMVDVSLGGSISNGWELLPAQ